MSSASPPILSILNVAPPEPITIPDAWPDQFYAFATEEGLQLNWKDSMARLFNRNPHWLLDAWVARELRKREEKTSLAEAWSEHPQFLSIAEELQTLFAEILWGFPPLFAPSDHYALLSRIFSGGFREVEMVIAIEQHFDANLPDAFFPMRLTMLEMVTELDRQLKKQKSLHKS